MTGTTYAAVTTPFAHSSCIHPAFTGTFHLPLAVAPLRRCACNLQLETQTTNHIINHASCWCRHFAIGIVRIRPKSIDGLPTSALSKILPSWLQKRAHHLCTFEHNGISHYFLSRGIPRSDQRGRWATP